MSRFGIFLSFFVVLLLPVSFGWSATLESPARGAVLSGLGFISGWKCNASRITVRINGGAAMPVAMRQPRQDTRSACGSTDNGFITQMNWALLGDGRHSIVAYDNGTKFASATFEVTTYDEEFVRGATGTWDVRNFPNRGDSATFTWNESTQHLELSDFDAAGGSTVTPDPPQDPTPTSGAGQFLGTWRFTNSRTTQTYRFRSEACNTGTCIIDRNQLAIIGSASILNYRYVLLHIDGNICRSMLLYEPQGTTVRGHYGDGQGSCESNAAINSIAEDLALERYPTTGTRISQSAAAPLVQHMEEHAPADIQEAIEQAIGDSLSDLLD